MATVGAGQGMRAATNAFSFSLCSETTRGLWQVVVQRLELVLKRERHVNDVIQILNWTVNLY